MKKILLYSIFVYVCISGSLHSLPPLASYIPYARTMLLRNGSPVRQLFFSPLDKPKDILLGLIAAEKKGIIIACYSITDKDIADALIAKKAQGIGIQIITDSSQSLSEWSKARMLVKGKIPVSIFPPKPSSIKMHNKIAAFASTIDNKSLIWTGSFNWSKAAAYTNQENVCVVEDGTVFRRFVHYFATLKALSKALK